MHPYRYIQTDTGKDRCLHSLIVSVVLYAVKGLNGYRSFLSNPVVVSQIHCMGLFIIHSWRGTILLPTFSTNFDIDHTNAMVAYFYSCYFGLKGFIAFSYFTTPIFCNMSVYTLSQPTNTRLNKPIRLKPYTLSVYALSVYPLPVYVRRYKGCVCVIAYLINAFQYVKERCLTFGVLTPLPRKNYTPLS